MFPHNTYHLFLVWLTHIIFAALPLLHPSEYKGVDERHRTKMIEHETTTIVVTDLDKYYAALDKALLRVSSENESHLSPLLQ